MRVVSTLLGCFFAISAAAQELPEQCVQLPQRTQVCPNLMYKRAPIDVPAFDIKSGDIFCICMADFTDLRIPASSEAEKVDQIVSLSRAAARLGMDEEKLLALIRN